MRLRLATLPTRGRVKTEFAARTDSSSPANGPKRPLAAYSPPGARDGTRGLRRRPRAPIGPRTVRGAVGLAAHRLRPAEEERRRGGIADGPSAARIAQLEQGAALGARDLLVAARVLNKAFAVEERRRRWRPAQGEGAPAHAVRPIPGRNPSQREPPPGRAAVGRQAGDAEAMDLGDHRVRGDPQLGTDLARPRPLFPPPAQMAPALLRPRRGRAGAWRPRRA